MRPPRSFVPLMAQSVPSPIRYVPPLRHLFFSFWLCHAQLIRYKVRACGCAQARAADSDGEEAGPDTIKPRFNLLLIS